MCAGVVEWLFFFQAEDGIRDWSVTGVQTCALPICRKLFAGLGRDKLVEDCPLAFPRPEDTAETLDVFATGGAAGEYYGDPCVRYVDSFVQDVGRYNGPVSALPKAVKYLLAFAGWRLVGYAWYEESPA